MKISKVEPIILHGREGGIQVAQPDLSHCGGFTHGRKIAWIAHENSVDVCPHAWLTDLLTASSLHFNATLPRNLFLEYNVSLNPIQREIITSPIAQCRWDHSSFSRFRPWDRGE